MHHGTTINEIPVKRFIIFCCEQELNKMFRNSELIKLPWEKEREREKETHPWAANALRYDQLFLLSCAR